MACLRLFTLPPLPPLPERSVPLFLRRIALATVLPAPLPYLRPLDFFFAAICHPPDLLVLQSPMRLPRPARVETYAPTFPIKLIRGLCPTGRSRQSSCDWARHAPRTRQISTPVPP